MGGQHLFELSSPRIPTGAGRSIREGQHQPWERTEARMGVRLLGGAMLGQTVVAAIIYGFVRTDYTGKLSEHICTLDPRSEITWLGNFGPWSEA